MGKRKRVESPENKAPRGVTVISEYYPDVKRQAAALLYLLGIGDDDTNTSPTPQASPEHNGEDGHGGRP